MLDPAAPDIYTLSLHDALPISPASESVSAHGCISVTIGYSMPPEFSTPSMEVDRKSTRLNSSHANISYAVFCLKKKNPIQANRREIAIDLFSRAEGFHSLVVTI